MAARLIACDAPGMKQLLAAGLIGVSVIACGGSAKRPAEQPTLANKPAEPAPAPPTEPAPAPADNREPTDAEVEAMMGQAMAMFVAMGDAVDAAGSDCQKLAAGLNATLDANRAFLASAKQWKGNPAMDAKAEAWMKDHMDEFMPHAMKVGTAGQTCSGKPEFDAVMKRFEEID
jgi:hypothetical protein